jgi:hypothetical protein
MLNFCELTQKIRSDQLFFDVLVILALELLDELILVLNDGLDAEASNKPV